MVFNENLKIENFILEYKNFASDEYCNSVIDYFENMSKSGFAMNRIKTSNHKKHNVDDNSVVLTGENAIKLNHSQFLSSQFLELFWKNAYSIYSTEYSILQEIDDHKIYCMKVQKTNIGEAYHIWHFENTGRFYTDRLMAYTLYLNDVEDGGETEFLYYSKRIKPEKGKLILWPASYPWTHRGNSPLSGSKYIVTGWVEF